MTPLQTLGLFLIVFFLVVLISQFRDWPYRRKTQYRDHDWLLREHTEDLKAAAMPRLYKGSSTGYRMPKGD